jgi:AraC family transcriptional regulator, regulatory protein of adaptative response / methylated-DNA-[protein]-cysteine methyltransferase
MMMNRESNQTTSNEEERWQAVQTRNQAFDGHFYYGVKSTGIYCRPSCSSRQPRREQVVFFNQTAIAEDAGFRACRRCHPQEQTVRDPQLAMVERACRLIADNVASNSETPLKLAELSSALGISPYHLQRTFKRHMGISPREYLATCRAEKFKNELKKGESVTMALYEAGYSSSSRLYEQSTAQLGMTPGNYRKGGSGWQINYTIVASPLGRLLIAATTEGICAVSLADQDQDLITALQQEYPAASLSRNDAELEQAVTAILNYLSGEQPHLDLPLDLQATAFQRRVWQELRAIPYGSTRSYGEIATSIGQPTASRAVARACATNPVALIIPCHRVVRNDQSLSGYRWGVERKAKLLTQERLKR